MFIRPRLVYNSISSGSNFILLYTLIFSMLFKTGTKIINMLNFMLEITLLALFMIVRSWE